ncbi:hypothetical protein Hanom_Chr03g00241271 [Helianthus anomalus]
MEDEGTNAAEVSGGSIFKILAGRQALKCPCVEDLVVNSTSATTGRKAQVKGNQSSASLVEISSSASAPTTGKHLFGWVVKHFIKIS